LECISPKLINTPEARLHARGNGREIFSSDFMVENIVHFSSGDRACVDAETYSYTRIYTVFSVTHTAVFAIVHIPLNKTLTFLRGSFMI